MKPNLSAYSVHSQSLTGNSSGLCSFSARPCQWSVWLPGAPFGQTWFAQTISVDKKDRKRQISVSNNHCDWVLTSFREFKHLELLNFELSHVPAPGMLTGVFAVVCSESAEFIFGLPANKQLNIHSLQTDALCKHCIISLNIISNTPPSHLKQNQRKETFSATTDSLKQKCVE